MVLERFKNRPLRSSFEEETEKVPNIGLGIAGEGTVLGAAGYFIVEAIGAAGSLAPGLKTPGYSVVGHSVEVIDPGRGLERHSFTIRALTEEVPRFVGKYFSAPSNLSYLNSDIDVIETEILNEEASYTTFKVVVEIERSAVFGD